MRRFAVRYRFATTHRYLNRRSFLVPTPARKQYLNPLTEHLVHLQGDMRQPSRVTWLGKDWVSRQSQQRVARTPRNSPTYRTLEGDSDSSLPS